MIPLQALRWAMVAIAIGGAGVGAEWYAVAARRPHLVLVPAPINVTRLTQGVPGLRAGHVTAPALVSVFGAYECGHCAEFERTSGPTLRKLAAQGHIRLVYIDAPFPAYERDPAAAAAAYCSDRQGQGWAMHAALYDHERDWSTGPSSAAKFTTYAHALGVDTAGFLRCLSSADARAAVRAQLEAGRALHLARVPAIFIDNNAVETRGPPGALLKYIEENTETRRRRGY